MRRIERMISDSPFIGLGAGYVSFPREGAPWLVIPERTSGEQEDALVRHARTLPEVGRGAQANRERAVMLPTVHGPMVAVPLETTRE